MPEEVVLMSKKSICLLDCTLRDGGYINDWNFGSSVISGIYKRLDKSGVDFIEVGFLDHRREFDANRTIFPTTDALNKVYERVQETNAIPVAMIDFGTCDIENISDAKDSFVKGIRVIFKKEKIEQALPFCKQIKEKGYMLFIQAISITAYSDEEMINYVSQINEISPYAFSIVDTYGLLDGEKMLHYFHLIDKHLDKNIALGYHSHNNFQLAFSNTMTFTDMFNGERTLIADSTVYGMGKSAGNCATELLAMYMNSRYGKNYDLNKILEIVDTYLMTIYMNQYWGYKYNFYIAAMQNCHPSYVQYLLDKKTLSVKAVNKLLSDIPEEKKLLYDEKYIIDAYTDYQINSIDDSESYSELKSLADREILLVGPGASIVTEKEAILEHINKHNPLVVSINFYAEDYKPDYIFISNSKRYSQISDSADSYPENTKIIATSNIETVNMPVDYCLNYDSLLLNGFKGCDNALILFLNALIKMGVKSVSLAGFDGYSLYGNNYYSTEHSYSFEIKSKLEANKNMSIVLNHLSDKIDVRFITETFYEKE